MDQNKKNRKSIFIFHKYFRKMMSKNKKDYKSYKIINNIY